MVDIAKRYLGKPMIDTLLFPPGFEKVLASPKTMRELIEWWKKTPEAIALTSCIVTDVLSDGYYFDAPAEINRKRAQEFAEENYLRETLEAGLYDFLFAGNMLLWKGTEIQPAAIKELAFQHSRHGFENKEFAQAVLEQIGETDEAANRGKELRNIPMSMVSAIPQDEYGEHIIYRQRSRGKTVDFPDTEVIHIKDLNISGEILAHSRMQSAIEEIMLIALIKDYVGNFFSNNGSPDMIFTLPNEVPNSPSYKLLIDQLIEGKKIERKHGNLVFTGEVKVQELNSFAKDMEFGSLAVYLTRVVGMVFHVPPARYGGLTSAGKKIGAEESAESMQGYYRTIATLQTKIEDALNSQFFKPYFKAPLRFNRSYKEDETREVAIQIQMTQVAEQRLRLGLWNRDAAATYLHIEKGDLGEEPQEAKTGMLNQTLTPNRAQVDSPTQARNNLRTPKAPTHPFSEKKEMENVVDVSYADFRKVIAYEVGNPQKARIHYKLSKNVYELFFSAGGIWYATKIAREDAVNIASFEDDFITPGIKVS